MNINTLFDEIRPIFGGKMTQAQVDGVTCILEAWTKHGDGNDAHLAYALATAKWETAHTMCPVRETLAQSDSGAKANLTRAFNAGKLKWVKKDYWSSGFFGRGFVQLTHEANYRKAGTKLGIDLVGNPSLALIPEVAADILVRGMVEGWFTSIKMSDCDGYIEMRRVVNGKDRAAEIAILAQQFAQAVAAARKDVPAKPIMGTKTETWLIAIVRVIVEIVKRIFGRRI